MLIHSSQLIMQLKSLKKKNDSDKKDHVDFVASITSQNNELDDCHINVWDYCDQLTHTSQE